MAKRSFGKRIKNRDEIITNIETENTYISNRNIKEKTKLFKLERATDKDYNTIFYELGMLNMSPTEISTLTNIPKNRVNTWLKKGEEDLQNDIDSQERDMYVSYMYGLKSLEASGVLSLMQKSPDKLLAKLNPDKYSDDIIDKFEIPTININVSERPMKNDITIEGEEDVTYKSEKKGE